MAKRRKKAQRPADPTARWNGFKGFTEYRYGPLKPVTLAGSAQVKPRIVGRKARIAITDRLFDEMSEWRSTPFENEGRFRHGVRSGLCLVGETWPVADAIAAEMVGEALRRIGIERPSWEEAQAYHCAEDACAWCRGPVPIEMDTGGTARRYCSDVCARSAIEQRSLAAASADRRAYDAARQAIVRSAVEARPCANCSRPFRPLLDTAKYCSTACSGADHRTLADRACATCGTMFRPARDDKRFCSDPCRHQAMRTFAERKCCEACGRIYLARAHKARCCSKQCAKIMRRMADEAQRPRRASANVIDFILLCGGCRITDLPIAA